MGQEGWVEGWGVRVGSGGRAEHCMTGARARSPLQANRLAWKPDERDARARGSRIPI